MEIFIAIGIGWVVTMGGLVIFNKKKKESKLVYYDISNKIRTYKHAKENTNINKKI